MLCGRAKNLIVTDGGKNVYPEEIEDAFQLYDEIEQITVQGYVTEKDTKSEKIEALVYPSDELLKRLNVVRNENLAKSLFLMRFRNMFPRLTKLCSLMQEFPK